MVLRAERARRAGRRGGRRLGGADPAADGRHPAGGRHRAAAPGRHRHEDRREADGAAADGHRRAADHERGGAVREWAGEVIRPSATRE